MNQQEKDELATWLLDRSGGWVTYHTYYDNGDRVLEVSFMSAEDTVSTAKFRLELLSVEEH